MDTVNTIISAISTVGFPIVACCGLFWFMKYLVDIITNVISENTEAINKLIAMLTNEEEQ